MQLAEEFLQRIFMFRKFKPQHKINESMHGESFILFCVASRKDMATPSEISEALCVSSARVTAALNSLERKGYITRRIDGADRRRVLIALTPSGRAEAERVRGTLLDILEKMLRSLGEYDAKEYVRITGRMAELALSEASL